MFLTRLSFVTTLFVVLNSWSEAKIVIEKCGHAEADIVFVIDSSASIGNNYKTQLDFIANITDYFTVGPRDVQFAAVLFSGTTRVLFTLDMLSNHTSIRQAIMNAPFLKGSTRTNEGLQVAREQLLSESHGARPNVTHLAIVITDGKSNNPRYTRHEADLLKATGTKVLAIGVGPHIARSELKDIASTARDVFQATSYITLEKIGRMVGERTCIRVIDDRPILDPQVEFVTTPDKVNYLSSKSQQLTCIVTKDPRDKRVISAITITRLKSANDDRNETVAKVTAHFGAHDVGDYEERNVTGDVSYDSENRSRLNILWPYPQDVVEGLYTCEACCVDKNGSNVTYANITQLDALPFTKKEALIYIKQKQQSLDEMARTKEHC